MGNHEGSIPFGTPMWHRCVPQWWDSTVPYWWNNIHGKETLGTPIWHFARAAMMGRNQFHPPETRKIGQPRLTDLLGLNSFHDLLVHGDYFFVLAFEGFGFVVGRAFFVGTDIAVVGYY